MAKRKKKSSGSDESVGMAVSSSGSGRQSVDISEAENGYIVNVSGETGGKENKYYSKRFIAADRPEAIRLSSSALAGGSRKGSKKKGSKKKISLKRG